MGDEITGFEREKYISEPFEPSLFGRHFISWIINEGESMFKEPNKAGKRMGANQPKEDVVKRRFRMGIDGYPIAKTFCYVYPERSMKMESDL
ncbi:unnamed protein product [Strongylus vulgaris]|uniref:Uncharacterized protein n=1 Tax=Strongylus vulgaris TaxID=40348 RepID=A0A3P7ILU7_STRVU|nr:unnamed protein product [Strongylus vulgaris]